MAILSYKLDGDDKKLNRIAIKMQKIEQHPLSQSRHQKHASLATSSHGC
jgi:hypothetical protein